MKYDPTVDDSAVLSDFTMTGMSESGPKKYGMEPEEMNNQNSWQRHWRKPGHF
jgi:hypothetical protein